MTVPSPSPRATPPRFPTPRPAPSHVLLTHAPHPALPAPLLSPRRRQLWESRNSLAAIRERLDAAWAAVDADAAALYNALVHGTRAGDCAAAAAAHPSSPASGAAASIVLASASAGAASAAATTTGVGGGGGGGGCSSSGSGGGGGVGGVGSGGGTPATMFARQVRAYVKLRAVFYLRSNTRRRLPAIFGAATTGARPPSASSYV